MEKLENTLLDYDKLSNLKIKYSNDRDNILEDFYIPVLKNSLKYKRAVGYFTSKILLDYIKGLTYFYKNGGTMELLISPMLFEEDIEILKKSANFNSELTSYASKKIEEQLLEYLEGEQLLKKSTELLFLLIVNNILKIKIAIPKNDIGIFHEKIGIFELTDNKKIAIIGSNNETYSSVRFNHESFNTFCDWKEGQNLYVEQHEKDFNHYWNNKSAKLNVFEISDGFVNDVYKKIDQNKTIDDYISEITTIYNKNEKFEPSIKLSGKLNFMPYDYQEEAASLLVEKKSGILEFATGSGKTKTAIYFMELLKQERSKNFFIISVPDKTLLEQWSKELSEYNDNIVKCNSDYPSWLSKFRNMIEIYNSPNLSNQVAIVTNNSMFNQGEKSKFLKQLKHLKGDVVLIVDEVHTWSTTQRVKNLPEAKYKVGLSATPFNDPETYTDEILKEYFKDIIAKYTLKDAILDNKLVPYNYFPIFVELTEDEKSEYDALTWQIAKIQSMYEKDKTNDLLNQLELVRYKRMRVVHGARNKIHKLSNMLKNKEIENKNLLIYCGATSYQAELIPNFSIDVDGDRITQLEEVNYMLNQLNIKSAQYTQKESLQERKQILKLFDTDTFTTLSAIKCLDEGVDIPKIENAVILASSGNKREHIQRRGRVLRKSPGKQFANIYDFVVIDTEDDGSHLNKIERKRVLEFSELSINHSELYSENKEYYEGEIYGEE